MPEEVNLPLSRIAALASVADEILELEQQLEAEKLKALAKMIGAR